MPLANQLRSTTLPHSPTPLSAPRTASLASAGLKHGAMLYLVDRSEPAGPSEPTAATSPFSASASGAGAAADGASGLTKRCLHGPRGRCVHCSGVAPGAETAFTGVCNHPPGIVCLHCSEHVKAGAEADKKLAAAAGAAAATTTDPAAAAAAALPDVAAAAQPAAWLCSHPPSAFCPKCLPPDLPSAGSGGADGSGGTAAGKRKIDLIPFARLMAEQRATCRLRHDASTMCAMCAPPPQPSFRGDPSCTRGHRPWPHGVCTKCAPANAVLRSQKYRHCDGVSMPADLLHSFYRSWSTENRRQTMRAAFLLGKYIDEPVESGNPGAIRALVAALYEPPQDGLADGVRLLVDANEALVASVAATMGLEVVGWVITTNPRLGGEKYGGKVFMSGYEVCTAAALQQKYSNRTGQSRFVTVVLEHGDNIEPVAYQVSDQCQALVRDGCIVPSPKDSLMLITPPPRPGTMAPSIVYHDQPLDAGKEFMPDSFLVKVILMTSSADQFLFARHAYPQLRAGGGTLGVIKGELKKHQREEYHVKLSDFGLLLGLVFAKIFPMPLMERVGAEIVHKGPFQPAVCEDVDLAFIQNNLLDFN